MFARIVLALLTILPFTCPVEAGLWNNIKTFVFGPDRPNPPTIRVLVGSDLENVPLEVLGKYSIYDPYTNTHISTRFVGKSKMIEGSNSGLKWGEEFPGLYQIKVETEDHSGKILVNGIEYPGTVYVYDIAGSVSVVNEVDVEHYLRSTLSTQFDQTLSQETMAALAIAARTNAYFQAVNPRNTYWAVDAEQTGYQGYGNVGSCRGIECAIDTTRHMIMSRTGAYEGITTPFALRWGPIAPARVSPDQIADATLTIQEAEELAKKGYHAAQILSKAFPGSNIMMVHYD